MSGNVYFPTDHPAEVWREMARDCARRERESFERCDTDGYLSQWAMSVTARLYGEIARVAERGGVWDFEMLADANGDVIEGAREYRTRYGWAWRLPDGRWFNPSRDRHDSARAAKDLAKGFQFVTVTRPAVVIMVNDGGLWGCSPVIMPRLTPDVPDDEQKLLR